MKVVMMTANEMTRKVITGRLYDAGDISAFNLKKRARILLDIAEKEDVSDEIGLRLSEASVELCRVAYCLEHGKIGKIGLLGGRGDDE